VKRNARPGLRKSPARAACCVRKSFQTIAQIGIDTREIFAQLGSKNGRLPACRHGIEPGGVEGRHHGDDTWVRLEIDAVFRNFESRARSLLYRLLCGNNTAGEHGGK
jgi:hypothetical protein